MLSINQIDSTNNLVVNVLIVLFCQSIHLEKGDGREKTRPQNLRENNKALPLTPIEKRILARLEMLEATPL